MHASKRFLFGGGDACCMSTLTARDLPLVEPAREISYAAVVKNPQSVDKNTQKLTVVAHQQDRPVIFLKRVLERLDRFDVEMVRRFVEDQQVRPGQHDHCERNTRSLSARECRSIPLDFIS